MYRTFGVQGILGQFRIRHVDDSVHVEGDFLGVGRPALIAETVDVFAVGVCSEGVVIGGNRLFEILTVG